MNLKAIGARIKSARIAAGYTQRGFCRRFMIEQSWMSRIESGHRQATVEVLVKICEALGLSADYVLWEKGSPPPTPVPDELPLVDSKGRVLERQDSLGRRLTLARLAKEMTQGQVAATLGVPQSEISNAELGKKIQPGLLMNMCVVLDLDPEELRSVD